MTTKADFTEEEWKTLQKGVTGAGMLISVADADFTDSFGEATTLAKYLAGQREQGGTDFIREVAATKGTGFGMRTSKEEMETETLDALRSATTTLTAKAPDEVDPYRQLVLGAANAVAEAKSGVESGETAAIAKIEEALG
ncbi:MAG TPA: hypothetical protein VFO03_08490 [Gaiellaceae bacterium]|nr:hypothetical protein [Gaiellaceae bacterium]